MLNGNENLAPAPAAAPAPALKKNPLPASSAVVGTSVIVLMVEVARSGALAQYKDALAPLIAWGPGLLVLVAFLWLAHSYAPPLILSQQNTATALQKLADSVSRTDCSCHDLVLAMQVNSDKLEQMRSTVTDLQGTVQLIKEDWRDGRK